jgi:hypothetical protein
VRGVPGNRLLPWLAGLGLAGSLLYRVHERGPYYPGWDVLGSAQGVHTLSAHPLPEALARLLRGVTGFRYWNSTNSLLYTLGPGSLGRMWPTEYWAHWLTFALVLVTFWLILRVAGLSVRDGWFLALAWGASSALLSFSVAGYPYATGFLPHALALAIVASPWLRAHPLVSVAAALLATEISWHLYEAGKTLIVVFMVAALVERTAPWAARVGWLLASGVQAGRLVGERGFNVDQVIGGAGAGLPVLMAAAGRTARALVRPEVDLPVVVPLGLLALMLVRRHRWLLAGGLASQLITVVLASATDPAAIRPRRLLTTAFYCLTILAVAYRQAAAGSRSRLRLALVTALVAGNLWQAADLALFFRVPPAGRTHPLPFTSSPDDYFVAAGVTEMAREARDEIDRGRTVVLLYNLNSEGIADPAALLERVYLASGHERFVRSVLAFGRHRCRYDCLPVRPLEDIEKDMAGLSGDGRDAVAFYKKAPSPRRHVEEATMVFAALRRHFDLRPGRDPAPGFGSLELARHEVTRLPVTFVAATEPLPLDLAWLADPRVPGGVVRTSPDGDRPFRYGWSAWAVAAQDVTVDFLLGGDGWLRLTVDGAPAIDRQASGLAFWRAPLRLSPGRHALALEYQAPSGSGRLVLQAAPAPPQGAGGGSILISPQRLPSTGSSGTSSAAQASNSPAPFATTRNWLVWWLEQPGSSVPAAHGFPSYAQVGP